MHILKIAAMTVALSLLNAAHADEGSSSVSNSEFLHQAEAGVFELTPATGIVIGTDSYRATGGLKRSNVVIPIGVGMAYGFSQMFSADFNLAYGSGSSSTTCDSGFTCNNNHKQKGLYDPSFDLKLRLPVGSGTLRFGTEITTSIEKSKIDSSGDSNYATGGTKVTPFVAYELPLGPGFLGGRVTYDVYKGDRKQEDNTSASPTQTLTGGESLSVEAFYEANVGKITYGGAIAYAMASDSKLKETSSSLDNKHTDFSATFYIPIHFTPTISLLPIAALASTNYSGTYALSSSSAVVIAVAGRFAF